jgi:hypothetical protein
VPRQHAAAGCWRELLRRRSGGRRGNVTAGLLATVSPDALGKGLRVFRLGEAEHHEVAVIAAQEYVSVDADRTPAAPNITSLREAGHLFGRKRHVMRPSALEIAAGDFALAAGHLRIAISLLAGTLNSAALFSMAAASWL